ncbi:hypothetical protein SISNIDRAFT_528378 [Sistotremastrum niveocremeum HHB9708]|uniref:Fat storage-inducing transmembrane protein n=1 Tax=Sistotremastrum niveocremeum HHB9708 TaxID=1314777 RepID=A0A164PTJ0_9AGAM|nr:hypothetical protein SISNIDRAFT_528378 [Sistotremastrum niveocremeum HHB9708]
MTSPRVIAFSALVVAVTFGTAYSVLYNTYLDTSNPLIANLPHPRHSDSYFAQKSNIFNVWFVKKAWGWTTAAFVALYTTSPPRIRRNRRIVQYILATLVWLAFTSWFFGPALIDRVVGLSGGECVIVVPSPPGTVSDSVITVPHELCQTKSTISPITHPELFIAPFTLPTEGWATRPKLMRGHDVSGHLFLLTLSTLFLADQLAPTVATEGMMRIASIPHAIAFNATMALVALWIWMSYTTSVYWHTPLEKVTGFALGLAGYAVTRIV